MTARRMSKQVAELDGERPRLLSEFLRGDHGDSKFVLRWVPLPPDVKHYMERRADGSYDERIELNIGCPHCHEDVKFRWDVDHMDHGIVRRLQEVLCTLRSVEFLIFRLLQPSEHTKRLVDVAERLWAALERKW